MDNIEDPIVMYLIVRENLGMSVGKTCAQVGHAVQMICLEAFNAVRYPEYGSELMPLFDEWIKSGYRKVVLRADDKEWEKIKEQCKYNIVVVIDNGLTEIAPNSETVIGLYPMKKSSVPKVIKRLQVLK